MTGTKEIKQINALGVIESFSMASLVAAADICGKTADDNNYISGLRIEKTADIAEGVSAGLFAKISETATVKKLYIVGASVELTLSGTRPAHAGVLAGFVTGSALIETVNMMFAPSCSVSVTSDNTVYAGGLIGKISGESAENTVVVSGCNTQSIVVFASHTVGDDAYAGGVCGYGENAVLKNDMVINSAITGGAGSTGVSVGAQGSNFQIDGGTYV